MKKEKEILTTEVNIYFCPFCGNKLTYRNKTNYDCEECKVRYDIEDTSDTDWRYEKINFDIHRIIDW